MELCRLRLCCMIKVITMQITLMINSESLRFLVFSLIQFVKLLLILLNLPLMILILSSMIAPPDVTSMAVLFAVIYPLYEVSIWIIVYFEKQAEKQAKLDGTWEEPDEE